MRVAALAPHLRAMHAVAEVIEQPNLLLLFGMREARPAAVRFELRVGSEEPFAARAGNVRAVIVYVQQRPGKRRLRAGLAQNMIALRPKPALPLLFALLDLGR